MGHFGLQKDITYESGFQRLAKEVNILNDDEFTRIALKYSDSIFRIAFNYSRSRADSDDIVQNVLLKYYKCDKEFESEEHIRNWLLRVAVNESKKLLISPFKKKIIPLDEVGEELIFEHKEVINMSKTKKSKKLVSKKIIAIAACVACVASAGIVANAATDGELGKTVIGWFINDDGKQTAIEGDISYDENGNKVAIVNIEGNTYKINESEDLETGEETCEYSVIDEEAKN